MVDGFVLCACSRLFGGQRLHVRSQLSGRAECQLVGQPVSQHEHAAGVASLDGHVHVARQFVRAVRRRRLHRQWRQRQRQWRTVSWQWRRRWYAPPQCIRCDIDENGECWLVADPDRRSVFESMVFVFIFCHKQINKTIVTNCNYSTLMDDCGQVSENEWKISAVGKNELFHIKHILTDNVNIPSNYKLIELFSISSVLWYLNEISYLIYLNNCWRKKRGTANALSTIHILIGLNEYK